MRKPSSPGNGRTLCVCAPVSCLCTGACRPDNTVCFPQTLELFETKGYRALKPDMSVPYDAFDRTERRFTKVKSKKAPTVDTMGITKDGALPWRLCYPPLVLTVFSFGRRNAGSSSDETESESEEELPPDTPTWRRYVALGLPRSTPRVSHSTLPFCSARLSNRLEPRRSGFATNAAHAEKKRKPGTTC